LHDAPHSALLSYSERNNLVNVTYAGALKQFLRFLRYVGYRHEVIVRVLLGVKNLAPRAALISSKSLLQVLECAAIDLVKSEVIVGQHHVTDAP